MSESTQSRDMCKDEVVLPTGLLADVRVRSWTAACDDVRTKDRATMAPFALASYLARRSSDAAIPVLVLVHQDIPDPLVRLPSRQRTPLRDNSSTSIQETSKSTWLTTDTIQYIYK